MAGPIDLKTARILVANDDGIDADGLHLLEKIARDLCDDVWTVAPATEQSGVGHGFSVWRPLRLHPHGARRFSVDGTPADCVMVGLRAVSADRKPTLMLSGINRGGNLAQDAFYSGTCAAAREAALFGVPSIAFSQVFQKRADMPWDTAARFVPQIITTLCAQGWPEDVMISVNLPARDPDDIQGIRVTRKGRVPGIRELEERHDPRGAPYYWVLPLPFCHTRGDEGTDLAAIADGYIAVTPLGLDLSHGGAADAIAGLFA